MHRLLAVVSREQHPSQRCAQQLFAGAGRLPLRDPVEQAHVFFEICCVILSKIARPGIFGPFDLTTVDVEVLQQTAGQCGFADTVLPEDRNA